MSWLPWPLSDDDLPSEVNYPVSKLKDINGWILSSQPTFQEETVAKDFYAVDRQSFVRADPTIFMRVILSTCYPVSRTQDPVSRKNCCQAFLVVGGNQFCPPRSQPTICCVVHLTTRLLSFDFKLTPFLNLFCRHSTFCTVCSSSSSIVSNILSFAFIMVIYHSTESPYANIKGIKVQ